MSEFEEWYSKNGTFNNIVDEAVWTDMERLFTFWQKTEKENARLREALEKIAAYKQFPTEKIALNALHNEDNTNE